jgi:hypothetical protein
LASLTDNFTGFAIHRQNAPETRDWLAKLMGTTAIWQSTDQTTGHGAAHSGRGSRRRVRQFRVSADTFAELERGEAIVYSTLGGRPQRAHVLRAHLPHHEPERIGRGERHACEITVHPASSLEQLVQVENGAPTISKPRRTAQPDRFDPPQLELPFDRRDGSP